MRCLPPRNPRATPSLAPRCRVYLTWGCCLYAIQAGYHNLVGREPGSDQTWGVAETTDDAQFERSFDKPGLYEYSCGPHSWFMFGTIAVWDKGALPETTPVPLLVRVEQTTQVPLPSVERTFYIQAEPLDWDYAATGANQCKGRNFTHSEVTWATKYGPTLTGGFIGTQYRKGVYRAYTDASFKTLVDNTESAKIRGIVGSPIHATVGDKLYIVLSNALDFPVNIRLATGIQISGAANSKQPVQPGSMSSYACRLTAESGPGPKDPSSIMWFYRSDVDIIRDTAAGLVGPLIISRPGESLPNGRPFDVDREMINVYWVVDETHSPFLKHNYNMYSDKSLGHMAPVDDPNFVESNSKYSINGYIYCNQPEQIVEQGERVRWYVGAIGTQGSEHGVHTPHFHGNTWINRHNGKRQDEMEVIPGIAQTLDMVPDAIGTWIAHCHINHHIHAGMLTRYTVIPSKSAAFTSTKNVGKKRTYYVAADEVEWDYVPFGVNRCGTQETSFNIFEQAFITHTLGLDNETTAPSNTTSGVKHSMKDEDMSQMNSRGGDRSRERRHLGHFWTEPEKIDNPKFKSKYARIGNKYIKAIYREYTDATFSELKPVPLEDQHKGLLGPVIRAEVGDTIEVVFKNNLKFKASVHPHGVFYPKNAEGATYQDGSESYDLLDDKISPGDTYNYVWGVPERAGPVEGSEGSSNVWLYHSHVDETADTMAGLVGPIVVTKAGHADDNGKPKDIDREFFAFFQIFDENKGRLFEDNLKKYLPGIDLSLLIRNPTIDGMGGMDMAMDSNKNGMDGMDMMSQDDDSPMLLHSHNFEALDSEHDSFYESNRMHAINGYVSTPRLPFLLFLSSVVVKDSLHLLFLPPCCVSSHCMLLSQRIPAGVAQFFYVQRQRSADRGLTSRHSLCKLSKNTRMCQQVHVL